MKKYIPYILVFIALCVTTYAILTHKNSNQALIEEKKQVETRIQSNRIIRDTKKAEMESIYRTWLKEDDSLSGAINNDKERLNALNVILNENSTQLSLIQTTNASDINLIPLHTPTLDLNDHKYNQDLSTETA